MVTNKVTIAEAGSMPGDGGNTPGSATNHRAGRMGSNVLRNRIRHNSRRSNGDVQSSDLRKRRILAVSSTVPRMARAKNWGQRIEKPTPLRKVDRIMMR